MLPIRSILVPTDFSTGAEAAAEVAYVLARAVGARVTLLHVYQLPAYVFPDGSAYLTPPDTAAAIAGAVDEQLRALEEKAERAGVPAAVQSAQGLAADEILRVAREGGYDLIVMGTHGRTGVKRLVFGSIAEQVTRHADRPVLTVRESERPTLARSAA
jgi:nucleotide-binding universal stress UspA family protein